MHPALRNKGCGRALFGAVQDLFFRLNVRSLLLTQPASLTSALLLVVHSLLQAASSVARWSIVSENEFMVKWSTKLGLGQPRHFQRFQAEPTTDVADADGYAQEPAAGRQCSAVQCSAVQCSAVQCSALRRHSVLRIVVCVQLGVEGDRLRRPCC